MRGQAEIAALGVAARALGAALHALPLPAALVLASELATAAARGRLPAWAPATYLAAGFGAAGPADPLGEADPGRFALVLWPVFGAVFAASVLACLGLDLAAKWLVLGRRAPGPHAWDRDPYCQNWQTYLTVSAAVRGPVRALGGPGPSPRPPRPPRHGRCSSVLGPR